MEMLHLCTSFPRTHARTSMREEAQKGELVSHMEPPSSGVANQRVVDLDTEMSYTTWAESCKDPHVTLSGDLRECRRRADHPGVHASGFAASRTLYVWADAQ